MINFLRIEFLSFIVGFRELIYSLAEKLDYRMKSFKANRRGNLIEKELDRAYMGLGKKALEIYSFDFGLSRFNPEMFLQEIRKIKTLKDQYSLSLQELSDLQRKALKESLSHCSEQFERSGWELAQIEASRDLFSFGKIKIKEIPLKQDFLILMIKKENQMELVNGETLLESGDTVICIGTAQSLQNFKSFLHHKTIR